MNKLLILFFKTLNSFIEKYFHAVLTLKSLLRVSRSTTESADDKGGLTEETPVLFYAGNAANLAATTAKDAAIEKAT